MNLDELNSLPPDAARALLERCCGAQAWVDAMVSARPFEDRDAIQRVGEDVARMLTAADWREAFAHHPRIGDASALRERFAATASWAAGEQRGAADAPDDVLEALAWGNRVYEERFGYIFIVCATGKRADEMLALLLSRLGHDPERELEIAAEEQLKITRLRIDKLLEEA
jgi:2-oxo-4-hydroxy-4-carboxy-5-ureidoimidazoline decarboxylase